MSWQSWEKTVDRGPNALVWRAGLFVLGFFVVFAVVAYALGWIGEAGRTAQEQFGPKAFVQKYEALKNTAASLAAKKKDIEVMEASLDGIRKANGDKPRAEWPRDERQTYQQREAELIGLKMSYNSLAAEYNAAMAKENWRFAKVGELPAGSAEVLPGEGTFAPYTTK